MQRALRLLASTVASGHKAMFTRGNNFSGIRFANDHSRPLIAIEGITFNIDIALYNDIPTKGLCVITGIENNKKINVAATYQKVRNLSDKLEFTVVIEDTKNVGLSYAEVVDADTLTKNANF